MQAYLDIVNYVLQNGKFKNNRTGIGTYTVTGYMFQHDMQIGFPLLTTKQVGFCTVASELEFFIKGLTDKRWLQKRNNHIWDEWATPTKAAYGNSDIDKSIMAKETDLGPIYGYQWRYWGTKYTNSTTRYYDTGIDQLAWVVSELKRNPESRRMLVSAWNVDDVPSMALPPCHYAWQVTVVDGKLNLLWNQRSVDTMLGLPFNIASYGLLLHLLSKETRIPAGKLVGFLADTHVYENHVDGAREQLSRNVRQLPTISTPGFKSIFDWEYKHSKIHDYNPHPRIKFDVAV